jgi:hypothetical protein
LLGYLLLILLGAIGGLPEAGGLFASCRFALLISFGRLFFFYGREGVTLFVSNWLGLFIIYKGFLSSFFSYYTFYIILLIRSYFLISPCFIGC